MLVTEPVFNYKVIRMETVCALEVMTSDLQDISFRLMHEGWSFKSIINHQFFCILGCILELSAPFLRCENWS